MINKLLIRIQNMFNLSDYSLNVNENRIELHGLRSDVENSISLLRSSVTKIKTKEINLDKHYSLDKADIYLNIINDFLNNTELFNNRYIYKMYISNNKLFLAYFFDIEWLHDDAYENISKIVIENILCLNLDITKFSAIISTSKWKLFEKETFNDKMSFFFFCR